MGHFGTFDHTIKDVLKIMLTATKISLILIAFGGALDITTSNVMLSMPKFFEESNPLYYALGSTIFNILFVATTVIVIFLAIVYDRRYSAKSYWVTSYGSLAIGSLYGGVHLYLGIQNILVFLNVMGSV